MFSSIASASRLRPIWLFLDSSKFGGIESHVEVLASALKRTGITVHVAFWGSAPPAALVESLSGADIPHRMFHSNFRLLVGELRKERPLLLHTHGYKANLVGRLAARLTGAPVIASYHAGFREPFPIGFYQRADEITSVLGGRIAVSETVQRSLPYASRLVENFVPFQEPPAHDRLPRRVAFVGRLTVEKGIDLFCEVAAQSSLDVEWHVFGDGPLRADLEPRYGARVRFRGFVANKGALWRDCGLLLMPSRAEGLPMAAIEAAIHGVPIAAASVGGVPDVVVDGVSGWLFPAGDVGAASRAVEAWAALPGEAQRDLIASCNRHASSRFSETHGVVKMLEAYQNVLPVH